jgi:hypothetical protein
MPVGVRCPGTKAALMDIEGRKTQNAFSRFEKLMQAVNPDGEEGAEPMEIDEEGGEPLLSPEMLLGGQEPSQAEERLWFCQRSRFCPPWQAISFLRKFSIEGGFCQGVGEGEIKTHSGDICCQSSHFLQTSPKRWCDSNVPTYLHIFNVCVHGFKSYLHKKPAFWVWTGAWRNWEIGDLCCQSLKASCWMWEGSAVKTLRKVMRKLTQPCSSRQTLHCSGMAQNS